MTISPRRVRFVFLPLRACLVVLLERDEPRFQHFDQHRQRQFFRRFAGIRTDVDIAAAHRRIARGEGGGTGHATLPTLNARRTLPTPLLNVRRMRIVYEPLSGATKSTSWKVSPVSVEVLESEDLE